MREHEDRRGRRRVSRPVALGLALVTSLALAGCSEEEPTADAPTGAQTATDGTGATAGTTGSSGEGSSGEGSAPTAAAPPTAPADIEIEPVDRSASGDGQVRVEGSNASFVMPSGNIACTVNSRTAVCQLLDSGMRPQADHLIPGLLGECTAADATAMILDAGGSWTCVEGSLVDQATVDHGGWWVDEVDGTTTSVDDQTVAVLPYGESITVGPVTCSSAENGVTCGSTDLGRQFTLSANRYNFGGL